jgi:hypothetical protein
MFMESLFGRVQKPSVNDDEEILSAGGGLSDRFRDGEGPKTEGDDLVSDDASEYGLVLEGEALERDQMKAAVNLVEYDKAFEQQVSVLNARLKVESDQSLSPEEHAKQLAGLDERLEKLDAESACLYADVERDRRILLGKYPSAEMARMLYEKRTVHYDGGGKTSGGDNPYQKPMRMQTPELSLEPLEQKGLNLADPEKKQTPLPINPDGEYNFSPKILTSDLSEPLDLNVSPEEKAAVEEALAKNKKMGIPMREAATPRYGNTPAEKAPTETWLAAEQEGLGEGAPVVETAMSGIEVNEMTAEQVMQNVEDIRAEYDRSVAVLRRNPILENAFSSQVNATREACLEAIEIARFALNALPEGERREALTKQLDAESQRLESEETDISRGPDVSQDDRMAA